MAGQSIFETPVAKVYPLLRAKAERKGRTKAELDEVIRWLTGYEMDEVDQSVPYGAFFENAPAMNPRAELITGKVCGVDVAAVEDPLMRKIHQLDKLVDELAKGRPMEKILR